MTLNFSFSQYCGIFAVPSETVDKYIKEASGDDLKVLLYIFRHANDKIELEKAFEEISVSEESFKNSVNFWVKKGVFKCTLNGAENKEKAFQTEVKKTASRAAVSRVMDVPTEYGQKEISDKMNKSPEIKFILESVPNQLGRLLNPSECSALVYLYEGAGIPADVIVMLVGYCAGLGKDNIHYIKNMALNFANEGIDTYEKAEKKITELEAFGTLEGKVRSALGIKDRALTSTEKKYINSWSAIKTTPDLIKSAYDICVARTGKLSFAYMDKILKSWAEKGIKTPEEAKNENRTSKKKKNSKTPSFDIDEYVTLSMKNLHNE